MPSPKVTNNSRRSCSSLSGTDRVGHLFVGLRPSALPYAILSVSFGDKAIVERRPEGANASASTSPNRQRSCGPTAGPWAWPAAPAPRLPSPLTATGKNHPPYLNPSPSASSRRMTPSIVMNSAAIIFLIVLTPFDAIRRVSGLS